MCVLVLSHVRLMPLALRCNLVDIPFGFLHERSGLATPIEKKRAREREKRTPSTYLCTAFFWHRWVFVLVATSPCSHPTTTTNVTWSVSSLSLALTLCAVSVEPFVVPHMLACELDAIYDAEGLGSPPSAVPFGCRCNSGVKRGRKVNCELRKLNLISQL